MDGLANEFKALCSRLELDSSRRLTLNGQAMILLPLHFIRAILGEVNAFAGPEAFRKIFHKAGYDGAITFCRRFREFHQCTAREAVEGYLGEMSLRGWGRFVVSRLDAQAGELEVSLLDSALIADGDLPSGNVIWEGAMLGAMTFLQEELERPTKESAIVRGEDIGAEACGKPAFRIVVSHQS